MRPIPTYPHGPRRRTPRPPALLLACPRLSPEWELAALRALIKPQTGGAIRHRSGDQPWNDRLTELARQTTAVAAERLQIDVQFHQPDAGDFWFVVRVPPGQVDQVKGLCAALSHALGEVWLVLGPLLAKNGRFYRRQRGYKLKIVPATNVHLTREVRAALRGLLKKPLSAR